VNVNRLTDIFNRATEQRPDEPKTVPEAQRWLTTNGFRECTRTTPSTRCSCAAWSAKDGVPTMTADRRVISLPQRPATVGALIEASEASGLSDDTIGRLILHFFPEATTASRAPFIPELAMARDRKIFEAMVQRAVNLPTARLLHAIRTVDDEPATGLRVVGDV
jgi:hypothetical protein